MPHQGSGHLPNIIQFKAKNNSFAFNPKLKLNLSWRCVCALWCHFHLLIWQMLLFFFYWKWLIIEQMKVKGLAQHQTGSAGIWTHNLVIRRHVIRRLIYTHAALWESWFPAWCSCQTQEQSCLGKMRQITVVSAITTNLTLTLNAFFSLSPGTFFAPVLFVLCRA